MKTFWLRPQIENRGGQVLSKPSLRTLRWRLPTVIVVLVALSLLYAGVAMAASYAANPDQCANGSVAVPVPCTGSGSGSSGWVSGNVNTGKAHWREGDSVAYRMKLSGITAGSWTLVIRWAVTQNGKHAFDYITSFDRTETLAMGDNPCDTVGCSLSNVATKAIPDDPTGPQHCVVPARTQIPGVISLFGASGTTVQITDVTSYGLTGCPPASGSVDNTIAIHFTSTDPNPVMAWGGHIATQADWGVGNSAVSISGSPYHMHLDGICPGTLDQTTCTTGGSQDLQLAAAAIPPIPTIATQVSSTSAGIGSIVTDTATLTGTNGTPTGTVTFSVCGPSATAPGVAGSLQNGCQTGGSQVGNPVTLNNGTATSAGYLVGAVGYYCFRADYVPAQTANYSPGSHTNTSLTNPLAECFQAFNATAVRIDSFKGAAISTGARLRWHTTTEVDVMGFNVWRSTSKIGVYKKLNVSLIGARNVGMPTGLGYTFVDKSAKIGKTYFYKLEIVGPVSTLEWTDSLRVKMQLSQ